MADDPAEQTERPQVTLSVQGKNGRHNMNIAFDDEQEAIDVWKALKQLLEIAIGIK